jgi:hypothetical protein
MATRLLAPVRSWEARRAIRAARRRADAELLGTRLPSPRLAWRVDELLADKSRIDLGRSLAGAVHAADERLLPGASPFDRGAIRECRAQLLELAARLCDLDTPVTARGVLLAERLLADGTSPLYGRGGTPRLRRELASLRSGLDGTAD